ncbi:RING-H2 finger protein ATL47-like [Carica papaya]|uniref:RING-H2 finger protein ATL47-like n=1 Tax=Carica papaya TaxID=3649 RepID=UPI000B8CACD6|nr:RING-H2 finger protein ATL47-like [Carica papaya]
MTLEVQYHLEVKPTPFVDSPPFSSTIMFRIVHVHRRYIEVEDDEMYVLSPEDRKLVGNPSIEINIDPFGRREIAKITGLLYDFGIPLLIGYKIVRRIRRYVMTTIPLLVEVEKITTYVHRYGENPNITRIIDDIRAIRSLSEPKTTPAAKSAIEALQKFVYDEQDDDCKSKQQCTICIEDFVRGSELNKMPCSHLFHSNCIVEWLQVNHTCPLCRYPLPCES